MASDREVSIESSDVQLNEEPFGSIDFRKDTCAIVGTAHKGPAFVPKSFITMGNERSLELGDNINSFARYFGDPTGSFNITSNARLAAEQWLNGDDKQVSFIRLLGAGNGLKTNSLGVVDKAGFVVGSEQVSGTTNHGKSSSNKYANENGPLGRTFFLGGFYYQSTGSVSNNLVLHPLTESFDQCRMTKIDGITKNLTQDVNGKCLYPIINGVLMFPSGVYPGLNASLSTTLLEGNEVAKGFFGASGDKGQHLGSGSLSEGDRVFSLFLNGYNLFEEAKINFNFNKESSFYYKDVFNTDPKKIEEKGHLLYASYDPSHSFHNGLKHLDDGYTTFILSSSLDRNISDTSNPNFEDFRARYRTAKTPWIVSQTFSIQNIDRTNITGSINNLFKFYSRSDGDIGNKDVYVIVHPKKLGKLKKDKADILEEMYSNFGIYVVDYDSDTILEKYDDCNLLPSSQNYIAKRIGTQYEYYNWETDADKQKVIKKGKFLNQSQFIRVEMHEDVEDMLISPLTMPSGFRGYRHIVTEYNSSNTLNNIASFNSNEGNTIDNTIFNKGVLQSPVPYTIQLKTQNNNTFNPETNDFLFKRKLAVVDKPLWGVNNRFKYKYFNSFENIAQLDNVKRPLLDNIKLFNNVESVSKSSKSLFDFSLFLPDAEQNGVPASWDESSNDVGLDVDLYNNNLFHLEKIIVHTGSSGDKKDFINWNLATYRRDGKKLTSMQSNTMLHSDYANYLNINSDLALSDNIFDARKNSISNNNIEYLAFSVFLAGGFDGVNIFDADKSSLKSDACVREENNELNNNDLNGPTLTSYKKAANLIADENLLLRDIVCMPGIESSTICKNNASLAEQEKTYLFIQDVPLSNFNYEIVTGSKSFYIQNFASGSGIEGQEDQDLVISKNTAEMHRRNFFFSSFNASYFGETQTELLQGTPSSITKNIPPTISALNTIATTTTISHSPSGKEITIGDGLNLIINDLNETSPNHNDLRDLYRSVDINAINIKDGQVKISSARTEDDAKPSLAGAIGTRRARSEIRKRIRDMSIREFLFENYSSRVEIFVIEYDRRVRSILQNYVNEGVLESFEVDIDSKNMTSEDIISGIVRGSIILKFVGREDIDSKDEELKLDDIIGTFERLVN